MSQFLFALLMAINFEFSWNPTPGATSYKLYKGPNETSLTTVVATVPAPLDPTVKPKVDVDVIDNGALQYFGVSALNAFGESPIKSRTDEGAPIALGKPSGPVGFGSRVK